MSDRGKVVFENGSEAFLPADEEASRKALKSAYPRCPSCEVSLNKYTVHKGTCTRIRLG